MINLIKKINLYENPDWDLELPKAADLFFVNNQIIHKGLFKILKLILLLLLLLLLFLFCFY